MSFTVSPRVSPGFVRVSASNPSYFENSGDGTLFWPGGINVPWTRYEDPGESTYDYYFSRGKNLMNATRVWLCHYAWIEWTNNGKVSAESGWSQWTGAVRYNQMICGDVDRMLALAEANGLRVMLVTEDNDEHNPSQWKMNPYNLANGGWCATPDEVFSNAEARAAYKKRLRYMLARWGASTSLWAINSWNDRGVTTPVIDDWLREMHTFVHGICDGVRPIVYGTNFQLCDADCRDYFQVFGQNFRLMDGMPNVVQECYFDPLDFKMTTKESAWSGLARGMAGVMVWDHADAERNAAWDAFRLPVCWAEKLALHRQRWQEFRPRIEVGARGAATDDLRTVCELRAYGDCDGWKVRATQNRFAVDLAAAGPGCLLPGLNRMLYGNRPHLRECRNPPTFVFDLAAEGEFVVDVAEIGGGNQRLEISVDGVLTEPRIFADGRREVREDERFVRVPLAAGHHEVAVTVSDSSDWLSVRRYLVVGKAAALDSLVQPVGRISEAGDRAFVFLRNSSYDRTGAQLGLGGARPIDGVRVVFAGLRPGRYTVTACDEHDHESVRRMQVDASGVGSVTLKRLTRFAGLMVVPSEDT